MYRGKLYIQYKQRCRDSTYIHNLQWLQNMRVVFWTKRWAPNNMGRYCLCKLLENDIKHNIMSGFLCGSLFIVVLRLVLRPRIKIDHLDFIGLICIDNKWIIVGWMVTFTFADNEFLSFEDVSFHEHLKLSIVENQKVLPEPWSKRRRSPRRKKHINEISLRHRVNAYFNIGFQVFNYHNTIDKYGQNILSLLNMMNYILTKHFL